MAFPTPASAAQWKLEEKNELGEFYYFASNSGLIEDDGTCDMIIKGLMTIDCTGYELETLISLTFSQNSQKIWFPNTKSITVYDKYNDQASILILELEYLFSPLLVASPVLFISTDPSEDCLNIYTRCVRSIFIEGADFQDKLVSLSFGPTGLVVRDNGFGTCTAGYIVHLDGLSPSGKEIARRTEFSIDIVFYRMRVLLNQMRHISNVSEVLETDQLENDFVASIRTIIPNNDGWNAIYDKYGISVMRNNSSPKTYAVRCTFESKLNISQFEERFQTSFPFGYLSLFSISSEFVSKNSENCFISRHSFGLLFGQKGLSKIDLLFCKRKKLNGSILYLTKSMSQSHPFFHPSGFIVQPLDSGCLFMCLTVFTVGNELAELMNLTLLSSSKFSNDTDIQKEQTRDMLLSIHNVDLSHSMAECAATIGLAAILSTGSENVECNCIAAMAEKIHHSFNTIPLSIKDLSHELQFIWALQSFHITCHVFLSLFANESTGMVTTVIETPVLLIPHAFKSLSEAYQEWQPKVRIQTCNYTNRGQFILLLSEHKSSKRKRLKKGFDESFQIQNESPSVLDNEHSMVNGFKKRKQCDNPKISISGFDSEDYTHPKKDAFAVIVSEPNQKAINESLSQSPFRLLDDSSICLFMRYLSNRTLISFALTCRRIFDLATQQPMWKWKYLNMVQRQAVPLSLARIFTKRTVKQSLHVFQREMFEQYERENDTLEFCYRNSLTVSVYEPEYDRLCRNEDQLKKNWMNGLFKEIAFSSTHRNKISSLLFCENSQTLFSGSADKSIRVWKKLKSRVTPVTEILHLKSTVCSLFLSSNVLLCTLKGGIINSYLQSNDASVWNSLSSNEPLSSLNTFAENSLFLSKNLVLFWGRTNCVLTDIHTQQNIWSLEKKNAITHGCFLSPYELLVTSREKAIDFIDFRLKTRISISTKTGNTFVDKINYDYFFSGDNEGTITLWDVRKTIVPLSTVKDENSSKSFQGHLDSVQCGAVGWQRMLTASRKHSLRFWTIDESNILNLGSLKTNHYTEEATSSLTIGRETAFVGLSNGLIRCYDFNFC